MNKCFGMVSFGVQIKCPSLANDLIWKEGELSFFLVCCQERDARSLFIFIHLVADLQVKKKKEKTSVFKTLCQTFWDLNHTSLEPPLPQI